MEKISKKNNITISLLFIAFVFAMILSCAFVCFAPNTTVLAETSTSEETQEKDNTEEMLENISEFLNITQEDYAFQKEDFVSNYDASTKESDSLAIFSNRTVTISLKNIQIEGVETELGVVRINSDLATPTNINGKDYFVISPSSTEDSETRFYVEIKQHYPKTPSKPQGEIITHSILFFIVQTPTDFEKESSNKNFIKWTYTFANVDYSPTAPETNQTYETIILSFPSGTQMNPIFVEFVYCGELYKIYRYSDNEGNIKTFNAINDQELDIDHLVFSSSGKYVVRIYDNTITSKFPNKNFIEYSFNIENSRSETAGFYIYAHTQDETNLMSGQFTNEDVIVDFINFDKIKNKVSEVSIIRAYQPSISENRSDKTDYLPSNLPSSISFTEDGSYYIKIEDTEHNILAKYEFVITKSIKNSFRVGDKDYMIDDEDESNMTKDFNITNEIKSSYSFQKVFYSESEKKFEKENGVFKTGDTVTIDGETTFEFSITVARSEPNIAGVSNNQRTQNNVNLRVYGVGTIDVYVTLNGTQMMIDTEYENGERLPTFTEQGKYFVRITDEMGSTVTKSFSITLKLNTASVILIAIACVIAFVLLVFFIISRGKVKVR